MPSYRCTRCGGVIAAEPDAQGIVTCRQCGAKLRTRPPQAAPPPRPTPAAAPPPMPAAPPIVPLTAPGPVTLEAVLAEIRAVRALQEQILGRLAGAPPTFASAPAPSPSAAFGLGGDDDEAPRPAPAAVRARRRKTVLLIDDDPASTQEAKAALDAAEVPVRTVNDGNAALGAIAAEKPDVIVIEQEMGGAMAGKDVINMIKATMEWVDIPIVLYTRANVTSQKEARTIHGADEVVLKTERAPALVSRVIAIFRKA